MKLLQTERFCGEPQARINDPLQCLSATQQQYLYRKLETLAEQCPDYSSLELSLSLDEYSQLKTNLRIASLRFQFNETCTSLSTEDSWEYLSSKAKQKIAQWKTKRFFMTKPSLKTDSALVS